MRDSVPFDQDAFDDGIEGGRDLGPRLRQTHQLLELVGDVLHVNVQLISELVDVGDVDEAGGLVQGGGDFPQLVEDAFDRGDVPAVEGSGLKEGLFSRGKSGLER